MLPQIAMGHSQSAIINTAFFENNVLNLSSIMIPPLMSSTMSGEDILGKKEDKQTSKSKVVDTSDKTGGRTELPDDQKSEKTI